MIHRFVFEYTPQQNPLYQSVADLAATTMGGIWAPFGGHIGFWGECSAIEMRVQVRRKSLMRKGVTGMGDTGLEPVTPCVSIERSYAHKMIERNELPF